VTPAGIQRVRGNFHFRSFNLKNLKSSLTQKDQSLEECIKSKSHFQQTVEELNQKAKSKIEELGSAQRERVGVAVASTRPELSSIAN
jgi:hypothetical protein